VSCAASDKQMVFQEKPACQFIISDSISVSFQALLLQGPSL
jgi:hypothetical protein